MKKSTIAKLLPIIAMFSALILQVGCHSAPKLVEYPPNYVPDEHQEATDAPIIVIGRLLHESQVDRKPRVSKWGKKFYVAMWRVTVHVENLLRGTIQPGDIDIYYFRYNFFSGPARVGAWAMGDRKLLFLRQDSGVLRTICDSWSSCVIPVLTGSHPDFQPKPGEPMTHTIVDLLLTRGENCSDKEMAEAIGRTKANLFANDYTMQKLRQIASAETPEVRQAACDALFSFGHPCEAAKSKAQ